MSDPAAIRVLVSACLLGERVRYHGGDARSDHPILDLWLREGRVIPHCPEVAGGLPTPREPAEIETGATALDVWSGNARVLTRSGRDVTAEFVRGARLAVERAQASGARVAVLKDGSPSCAVTRYGDRPQVSIGIAYSHPLRLSTV